MQKPPRNLLVTSNWLIAGWILLAWPIVAFSESDEAEVAKKLQHFEQRVRPLLIERCNKCHSGNMTKAGLRLDSARAIKQGGESGPAVVPGNPNESLLIQAVRHEDGLKMPPDGKLSEAQIGDLVTWVKSGAVWPRSDSEPANMPTEKSGSTIRPMTPNDPAIAGTLQLWFSADDLKLADRDAIEVWSDRSGHGRDLAATKGRIEGGIGTSPRFFKVSTLEERPAVRFDAESGLAASPKNPVPIRGDMPATIVMVMNLTPNSAAPNFDCVFGIGDPAIQPNPGKPTSLLVGIGRHDNHSLRLAGGWYHDASLGSGSLLAVYGKSTVLTIVKQPGKLQGSTTFFINGRKVPLGEAVPADNNELPDVQHRTDMGAFMGRALSWSGGIIGDVGEVVLYSKALLEVERQALESYLGEKYKIPLDVLAIAPPAKFLPHETSYWAYQPVQSTAAPLMKDRSILSSIDQFVQARLKSDGLAPAPLSDKRTLLRRVTFDLTGLPPTPAEIRDFLADASNDAHSRVVDRLLASPYYGQAWGRHWLDIVRYADTTANDGNAVMRFAYRYRDYVVDAINRNKPYDQFIIEQLAGDLLPPVADLDEQARRVIATGFLMVGPKALAETDKEQTRLDIVDDQIDVTSRAILGLTVSCARCHDHKFDAIRATDYYALAGIFRSTEPLQNEDRNASMWWEFPLPQTTGEPIVVMAPKESQPRDLRIHLRGNRFTLGATALRGFLQVLPSGNHAIDTAHSGRLELAQWIADAKHPLTARVMVNRIWQTYFRQGLVASSDNFGTRGERPSHPELLDWLASRFVESGWDMKAMHRLILNSHVYQQQCLPAEAAARIDPENRLLSYFPRRRLQAEELRDSLLFVSGGLNLNLGGNESSEALWSKAEGGGKVRPNTMRADDPFYASFRGRSVYLPIVRNTLPDVLALFDAADPNSVAAVRNDTTVPSQALFLMNSPFVREVARQLATSVLAEQDASLEQRLQNIHERLLGRPARPEELAEATAFLSAYEASPAMQAKSPVERRMAAWQSYCQAVCSQNEFLYRD